MRYAMIMAGGSGTRLWPMSRRGTPKQLIQFVPRPDGSGMGSLLEFAVARLDGLVPPSHQYICTGEAHRQTILKTVPGAADDRILGEPVGRDTLNAVGFGASVFASMDPDAVFAVLTADHLIQPVQTFHDAMEDGFRLVEEDPTRLVTFGIKPTFAATGFGYIEQGPAIGDRGFRVARFVEKPDQETAEQYVASGRFFWNSGMFIFHAAGFMDLLQRYRPDSHAGLARIGAAWGTPRRAAVLADVYPALPKISVDYAVMEPASSDPRVSICGVRMDIDWLDVGSWPAFGQTVKPDADDNRVSGTENVVSVDGRGNLVISSGSGSHTIAMLGCENLIVVRTPDATLIMPRDRAQDLKRLHERVPDELR